MKSSVKNSVYSVLLLFDIFGLWSYYLKSNTLQHVWKVHYRMLLWDQHIIGKNLGCLLFSFTLKVTKNRWSTYSRSSIAILCFYGAIFVSNYIFQHSYIHRSCSFLCIVQIWDNFHSVRDSDSEYHFNNFGIIWSIVGITFYSQTFASSCYFYLIHPYRRGWHTIPFVL